MSLYLDTSVIVSLLAGEPGSGTLQSWLQAHEGEGLTISPWVDTEVASALSLKVRTGALTLEQRTDAMNVWQRWREGLLLLPVERAAFNKAAGFAARHALALRASDALHLAIAAAGGCTLVTLDERMAAAAAEVGVAVAAL